MGSLKNFGNKSGQNSVKKDRGLAKFQQMIESPENFYPKKTDDLQKFLLKNGRGRIEIYRKMSRLAIFHL